MSAKIGSTSAGSSKVACPGAPARALTSAPRLTRARTTAVPMKPPAPLTNTVRPARPLPSSGMGTSRPDQIGEQVLQSPNHDLGSVTALIPTLGLQAQAPGGIAVPQEPKNAGRQRLGIVH